MKQIQKLNKLANRIYPSTLYSRVERRQLKNSILDEMLVYIDNHPDASIESIQQQFCDNETITCQHELSARQVLKYCLFIGLAICVLCFIMYFVAKNWLPPTYTF